MKIAVLSHKDVGSWYEAKLLEMGHETMSGGGAVHAPMLKGFLECDGCLLLGEEDDLTEIAYHMELAGKPIWRNLTDIPK